MNCFHHPQKAAIGHCTFCGRGLCHDCATVIQGKLSCRGECQNEIVRERRVLAGSETSLGQRATIYETSSALYQKQFAFLTAFGIGFLIFGIALFVWQIPVVGAILGGMGAIFLINGLSMRRASKKFKALAAEGRDEGSQS